MADEGYDRDFPGNPNPTPKAPAAPVVQALAREEGGGGGSGGAAQASSAAQQSRPAKAVFNVSADESGRQSVYMMDDQLETTNLGPVSVGNADELLTALGEFNPATKTWRVPEAAAKQLLSGDIPVDEYVAAKYRSNKALIARGAIYTEWLSGKATLEDAQGRGDLETLKMQVKEAPLFVWQGDVTKTVAKMWADAKEAGVSGAARRVAGETAGLAAFSTDSPMAAAMGMSIGASLVVSRGASAPVVAAGLAKTLEVGAGALVFKRSYEIEGGNAAAEMLEKGFDEATVKKYAPLAGVVNGALEVVSFRLLAAPFKRVVLKEVLASEGVKKAVTSAYVSYVKELGGEIAQEEAQEAVNVMAEAMAAEADARPDLAPKADEVLNRFVEVGLKTLMGTAGIKTPGLVLEAGVQRADAKAQAAMTEKLKKRAQEQTAATAAGNATPAAADKATAGPEGAAPLPAGSSPSAPAPTAETGGAAYATGQHEQKAMELDKLVEELSSGKIGPDEATASIDKVVGEASKLEEMDPTPRGYGEQVAETERKARLTALRQNLNETTRLTDELVAVRDRFIRQKQSTARLDSKLEDLMQSEADIRGEIEFYDKAVASRVGVGEHDTLAMKPATLENIIQVGFKEGRKEVIETRARAVKDVAAKLGLTQADVRLLLKDKNIGLMGDVEFRHWLEGADRVNPESKETEHTAGFVEKAAEHAKRKVARAEVKKTLKERAIKREQNIRALHDLPAPAKMTTKQLWQYVDILNSYAPGSVAMTPKRVGALSGSVLRGARTFQDVLSMVAGRVKSSLAGLLASRKSQFDPLRGDTELSEANPVYAFAVRQVQTEEAIGDAVFQEFEKTNHALGAAALASRSSLLKRMVPSMPEVMAHLEADPGQVYAGQVTLPAITPEEQAYVDFLHDFFQMARDYLFSTGELETTRFEKHYAPHTRRTAAEILVGIKDVGARKALGEFFDNLFAVQKEVGGPEVGGPALGLRKFFKNTLFRTGEMTPSTNVIRISNAYAKQFFRKQALDRAVPVVDTLVEALAAIEADKTEEGQAAVKALGTFVKTYLNNKKGVNNAADALAPRGGVVDIAVRLVSGWISLAYIGGNLALQATAPVGETLSSIPVLGLRGLTLANARLLTKQGKAIVEKYESFIGKGALTELLEPGKQIDQRAGTLLYSLLQWGRTRTLKTVLLGSMTDAEFAAGVISPERLAEIKTTAGRWMDIHGMKSVLGSTSVGAAFTKFRGWLLPILRTTAHDITALVKHVGTRGDKPMTRQQATELYRIAEVTLISSGIYLGMMAVDEDDDTFVGQLKKKLVQEMFSLTQVFHPTSILTAGPVVAFLTQLGKNLEMLLKLEEYKPGSPREGELKAPRALLKQLPFSAAVRNFTKEDEKKP